MSLSKQKSLNTLSLAVCIALFGTTAVHAQQQQGDMERIQVTASALKINTPMAETPVSVAVVGRDDLDIRNVTKLDESFRYTAGVLSAPYGADNDTDWLNVRGFEAATYLDGSRLFKDGFYVWMLEPYGLEQVEVLKGPASILYGEAPPGGVVNAVQKKPTLDDGGEVSVQVGNKDTSRVAFDVSNSISDDQRFRIVGKFSQADGELDDTENTRYYLAPSFAMDLSEDTSLTFLASVTHDDGTPTNGFFPAIGTQVDDPRGKIDPTTNFGEPDHDVNRRTQVTAGYQLEHIIDDTWDFKQNFNYAYSDLLLNSTYIMSTPYWQDPSKETYSRGVTYREGDIRSLTFDNRLVGNWTTNRTEQTVLLGVDVQNHRNEGKELDNYAYDVIDPFNFTPGNAAPINRNDALERQIDKRQASAYGQYQLTLDDHWIGIVGGRFDYVDTQNKNQTANKNYDRNDNQFSLNAGLMYRMDSGFTPYVSYAESFEVISTVDQITGELYKPLEGKQTEVGFKYSPDYMDGYINLAWYNLKQNNALVSTSAQDPDGNWLFGATQTGEMVSQGVEFEAVMQLSDALKLNAAYTYTDSHTNDHDGSGDKRAPMIPRHQASAYLDYQIQPQLRVATGVRYVGSSMDAKDSTVTVDTIKVPSYWVWDTSVQYDINSSWRAQLTVNNVLDNEYVSACNWYCYYGESRSIVGSIKYMW
ncbi:TonB-dependent siderophore receptor [Shewanella intestini]|uniref:TonB-dependent siderophore receptor n=1 Tax=Shewanella intestini TaxID=2017544 RepID=A0ABS5I228_9GAMM|nr:MULTISPECIES: TonB-dependent siderophore receptor [Shewanella]MBR9727415.1 TonB-dependent siderophore receptor [Shewanella intestini]MRG35535.1 TonB-dependent siderophore receptor [Shewanella sp. XMDDZSB0408]